MTNEYARLKREKLKDNKAKEAKKTKKWFFFNKNIILSFFI